MNGIDDVILRSPFFPHRCGVSEMQCLLESRL